MHLWRYKDGFAGTDKAMEALMTDAVSRVVLEHLVNRNVCKMPLKELRPMYREQSKMCSKRKNCLLLSFSYWGDPKPRPPKNIYELRSYVLRVRKS